VIFRGDAPGRDGLREILEMMVQAFDRRRPLARWTAGEAVGSGIRSGDAPLARAPAVEPLVLALPGGACLSRAAAPA